MGILQVRILEWVAVFSSRGSSDSVIEPESLTSPALAGRFFNTNTTSEGPSSLNCYVETLTVSVTIFRDRAFEEVFKVK